MTVASCRHSNSERPTCHADSRLGFNKGGFAFTPYVMYLVGKVYQTDMVVVGEPVSGIGRVKSVWDFRFSNSLYVPSCKCIACVAPVRISVGGSHEFDGDGAMWCVRTEIPFYLQPGRFIYCIICMGYTR